MVQIFQPILHHVLIYIDDILLFSGSHDEHRQQLTQFYDIVQSYGIMLSAKKSTIATDNIEFLGMIIKDGHYQPGKHIAQELLHFHYKRMSLLFYKLNGFNEPTLKHVFLASLPEELQPDIQRQLTAF